MLKIRNSTWNLIRKDFSENEKEELKKFLIGEIICPPCFIIDETKLNVALEFKIIQAIKQYDVEHL